MVEKISRSEQKRLFKQVEELAKELSTLSNNDLKSLDCEEEVKDEILNCRSVKGGALKRQVKYLAKVMRQYPLDEIYKFLKTRKGSELKENQVLHEAERWRDVLINDAMELYDECRKNHLNFEPDFKSNIIDDIIEEFPSLNELDLRRTVYTYVRTRNKLHYRELFRAIKAAIELVERQEG